MAHTNSRVATCLESTPKGQAAAKIATVRPLDYPFILVTSRSTAIMADYEPMM